MAIWHIVLSAFLADSNPRTVVYCLLISTIFKKDLDLKNAEIAQPSALVLDGTPLGRY